MKVHVVADPFGTMFLESQLASVRKAMPDAEIVATVVPSYDAALLPRADTAAGAVMIGPGVVMLAPPPVANYSYSIRPGAAPIVQGWSGDGSPPLAVGREPWTGCDCPASFRIGEWFAAIEPVAQANPDAVSRWMECVQAAVGPEPPRPGLGDMVSDALSSLGITKERVGAAAKAVGIKDCGCSKRQSAVNAWGAKYLGLPPGRG